MKWAGRVLLALVVLVVLLCAVAFLLPTRTEHARTIELHQTPEMVFAALADVQKLPEWNRNVKTVEVLPLIEGKEASRQTFGEGMSIVVVTTESLAPTHLVREIRDSSAPFGGSWTYDISPTSDGSKVVLTEKSEIKNPFFRLMVQIFGPTKYLNQNLTDLGRRFGEKVTVR